MGALREIRVIAARCPLPAMIAEARRVLVPGGRIVLLAMDWDATVIDSADPVRTRG